MSCTIAQRCLSVSRTGTIGPTSSSQCRRTASSAGRRRRGRPGDHFSPSPFERRSKINISDKFAVHRELREDDPYGVRRYLLFPRGVNAGYTEELPPAETLVASLNANRNVLFGARLHRSVLLSDENEGGRCGGVDDKRYRTEYLSACGPLLDLAQEDSATNGQQVQALARLGGLCSWVASCLDVGGEGSSVLRALMQESAAAEEEKIDEPLQRNDGIRPGKRARQRINDHSGLLTPEDEPERLKLLEAVQAIATGVPRPGHSVVGAGTYRDGMRGWVALAREYAALATVSDDGDRRGLEEVALYRSRDGEVASIEHLANTRDVLDDGGAMARIFFV